MDLWMATLGGVFVLAGALQAFFADEIARSMRKRGADDFFTNPKVWRYAGYAAIAVGAATLAIAYF
jgi:hypothetical protein